MIRAFVLAFEQLFEPELRRPLLETMLWAALLFAGLWGLFIHLIDQAFIGNAMIRWLADTLGAAASLLLTWLLYPGVAIMILGFYSESIIRAVERRYYPELPPAPPQSWGAALGSNFRLIGLLLLLNILALPFYFFAPGINLILFCCLNGYLLAREYFELVALRRLERGAARMVWRTHRLTFFAAGVVLVGVFAVPVLNLAAPIIGTAALVHLVERAQATTAGKPVSS